MMTIKIKENKLGHLHADIKWKSHFAYEWKTINLETYPIGRKEEELCKELIRILKEAKANGRLRY